jgi:spore germination protein KB
MLYVARKGAGTIARVAFFVGPYILLTILLFLLLSLDQLDLAILQPVLADSSFLELNLGAFLTACYSPETLALLVLATFLRPKTSANKILVYSTLLFAAAFMIMVIPTLTLLGLDIARHSWNPYYMFTRQVTAFSFIQRVESLNVIAWYLGLLIKSALFLFMSCYTLSRVFGTKSHAPFVAPACLVAFVVLLLPYVNRAVVIDFLRSYKTFTPIMLFFIFVLPLAVIAVYLFRRRRVDARLRAAGGPPRAAPSS